MQAHVGADVSVSPRAREIRLFPPTKDRKPLLLLLPPAKTDRAIVLAHVALLKKILGEAVKQEDGSQTKAG